MSELEFHNEMTVEFLDHLGSDVDIARAAWVSTMGERADEGNPDRIAGLINMLMRDRHGSPFEQGMIRFRVTAPIVVFREHHRHRIGFSYNEMSGRYVELPPRFYIPAPDRPLIQRGKPGAYQFEPGDTQQYEITESTFRVVSNYTWEAYQALLTAGIAKEVARMVLPLNLMSTMVVAMNPRSLMNFLNLRVRHPMSRFSTFPMREIEMVALEYEETFADLWPITWRAFMDNGRLAP